MDATNLFAESQTQLSESQKKIAQLWDDSQKQLMESQKKLVETWKGSLPSGTPQVDLASNYEKAINFQRELVNSALNAQQVSFRFAIDSQKQLWDDYFQTSHKVTQQTINK